MNEKQKDDKHTKKRTTAGGETGKEVEKVVRNM
jgi:hypothetical protein